MALKLLLDYLTGHMALVDVPVATTPAVGGIIPVFFFMIPQ